MLKKVVLSIFLFLLVINIVNAVKVDKIVEEKLENETEVSVIVVLKDDYSSVKKSLIKSKSSENKELSKKKLMIEKQQDKVLENLNYEKISIKKKSLKKIKSKIKKNKTDFRLKHKYKTVNGFSGKITKEGLEKLKQNPDVERVYINGIKNIFLDVSVPLINATKTWSLIYNNINLTGAGETVCIIDTGVDYNHTNLGGGWGNKVIGGYNSISGVGGGTILGNQSCDINNTACYDDHGHGTHVAGIIASNHTTYKGVAPDAKLVVIKACNSGGSCADSDVIAGIDWCTNNATNLNISVISMSLGAGTYSDYCNDDSLAPSINTAVGQNISVVVAAGNNNPNDNVISSPACVQNATPIGAVNDDDVIQFNRNNKMLEILAPGIDICAPQAEGTSLGPSCGTNMVSASGTSMSTPHAAGAFALINQYRRLEGSSRLTPTEIGDALNDTGKAIADGSDTYRRINIYAAIQSLDTKGPVINFVNPTPANNSIIGDDYFFINITSDEVINTALFEFNNTNTTMNGSGTNWYLNKTSILYNANYSYKVYANDSFGNIGVSEEKVIYINLTIPKAQNIVLNSTDILNRTNGSLIGSWTFFDPNNDAPAGNETKWYNNSEEVIQLRNLTIVSSYNTSKNQNWTFSVRVFDGLNFSEWVNSSNLTIRNSDPILATIPNIILNETDLADINATGSVTATDNDGDSLVFNYTPPLNSIGKWLTTTTDARNYTVTVNVSDGDSGFDSQNVIIAVLDKVSGANDTVTGNITDIKTNIQNLQLKINGTNFSLDDTTLGVNEINFSDSGQTIVVFDFNFTNTSKFNFIDMKINKTKIDGAESLVVQGIDLTSQNRKKTLYLNRTNTTFNSVCIKDSEISSIEEMSSDCSSPDIKLACDGVATSGFTCTLQDTAYKITGLSHSGIKQISYTRPSDSPSSSPSSSGGSSGGGGGFAFTCNMDWNCDEWSECINRKQTRTCEFVKVPQHASKQRCPSKDKPPETNRSCEISKKTTLSETEEINETEETTTPTITTQTDEEPTTTGGLGAVAGAVIEKLFAAKGRSLGLDLSILAILIIVTVIVFYKRSIMKKLKNYIKKIKRKKQKNL